MKRITKLTNQDKGNAGENLTKKMFNLSGTGGSGVGAYDKLDCKNEWIKAETKCTGRPYYNLSIEKFEKWRLQAAEDRRQFFLHLIPETDGKLSWEQSLVVITEAYFMALAPDLPGIAHRDVFVEKSHRIKFDDYDPVELPSKYEELMGGAITFNSIDRLTTPTGSGLIVLRAPYFKELLEKDEEIQDNP